MSTFKRVIDLSDCPEEHILEDKTVKNGPLTMTDELNAEILKVVCRRSKSYSIDNLGGTKQSVKGVEKSVKKTQHHSLFKKCLSRDELYEKE